MNWTWTTPDGANLGLSTTSGNSTTVTGLVTGTATLTATDDGVAGCSATAAIRVIPAPGAWTQLIYEDFEGALGNFVSGGTDALLYTYSSGINFAAAGTGALDIQDDTGDTAAAALGSDLALASGLYTELEVEFQYYAVGINTGDGFSLQFSSDGGATWTQVTRWTEGAEFANDAFYSDTVTIPTGSYPFTDAVRLRFECHGATNNDDVYIDEVRIRAR